MKILKTFNKLVGRNVFIEIKVVAFMCKENNPFIDQISEICK